MGAEGSVRILIVDDERPFLSALSTYLSTEHREIISAHDGKTGIALLEEDGPFQIIVTDLVMPGLDGLGLLERALEIDSQLLVIVMSGYGTVDTAVNAMRKGAFDYKTKPFLLEEMGFAVGRAEQHLRLRHERDRLSLECQGLRSTLARVRGGLGARDALASAVNLRVLANTLTPHEASSSYQQWDPAWSLHEDLSLLRRLKDDGAISTEQYLRLSQRMIQTRGLG
ncbi:MAG: response regulator [Thermodesulfobacteriota bacterium]